MYIKKDQVWGFSDPATADKLENSLKNASNATVYRYPEQGHSFLSSDEWSIQFRKDLGFCEKDLNPLIDEKEIREEAWNRIYQFFINSLN